ncbi:hypothetical protein L4D13_15165 [Photobacterium profundum]|uniref:hypothetical protein n=1 Tax=Photobacterium profundum TaxID=74109 RepID=UPI003D13B242
MAAEKLTKSRLIQIIVLMAVLISAFVWRTVTYEEVQSVEQKAIHCTISEGKCLIVEQGDTADITLTPLPATAESPLVLQIGNINVKPTGVVEGVDMFMGTIPVIFSQKGEYWVGNFSVPACIHDEMDWKATITQGNQTTIVTFKVKK